MPQYVRGAGFELEGGRAILNLDLDAPPEDAGSLRVWLRVGERDVPLVDS